jgi:diguanylate cyclase (GGDEF)-like protein
MAQLRPAAARPPQFAWIMTGPLAVLAVAVAMTFPFDRSEIVRHLPGAVLFFGLFVLATATVLYLEVKRYTVTVTMTEIPLLLALFYLPPLLVIITRVAALAVVHLWQRHSLVKVCFNMASLGLATCVASSVVVAGGPLVGTGPDTWARLGVAVAASTLVSLCAVIGVITLVQGPPNRAGLVRAVVPALVAMAGNIIVGLIVLPVVQAEPWSILLLLGLGAVLVAIYRSYAQFMRQHKSLSEMYDLTRAIGLSSRDGSLPDELLGRVRQLMHAEYATLWLPATGRHPEVLLSARAEYSGLLDVAGTPHLLRERVLATGESVSVGPRVGDEALRDILRESGTKDAIVVPLLSGSAVIGTLEVASRLGDVTSFGPADVRLLETVAAHAAVAVENSRLVERLRFDAYHDPLTGLPNRKRLVALLEEAVKVRAPGEVVAVLVFDLAGLRDVNDSLGHDAGDQMISEVARRLRALAPAAALVGRAGSDEFVVTLRLPDVVEAAALAHRLRGALQEPMEVETVTLDVDVSVGIAVHPDHGTEADVLLKRAGLAAQAAKRFAVPVHQFHPSLQARSTHRLGIAADLRRALEIDQVEVYFQPKVALPDRQVVGVECLARWQHPDHGQVPPTDFVAVAEHTGQLGRLTDVVLGEGLRRARGWLDAGRVLPVAVNISARTLIDQTFPPRVAELLSGYGVPPSLLTLEITEDGMVGEPDRAMSTLRRLSELGVRIAVDDFGTGYSSLSYLRRLPVDEVKIDQSFVQGMATDTDDLAIVRAVVDLARHFRLVVVAEGVESELTVSLLESLGCDVGQGFLFSRPLPYERFEAWVAAQTEPAVSHAALGLPPRGPDDQFLPVPGEVRRLRAVP